MPVYRLLKRILFGANSKNFPNFAKIPISTKKAVKTENLKEMVKDIKKMSKTAENIFRDNDFKKSILFQSLSYFVIGCGAIYITTRLSDETFINHMNQKSSFFSEWLTEDFHRKNPGKVNDETKILKDISFEDVCGNEEAKEELADIVDFMKNPEKYKILKAKISKGVLLHGPPGCGKTLLARALAGESNVSFLSCESSAFDQVYVGIGPARVRKLFERAREIAPCIVFIDEMDLFSRSKTQNESNETTNELLTQLDGFKENDKIVVIGSTNMRQMIDKTLLRSGRFDRSVYVPLPELKARKQMLHLYSAGVQTDESVDFDRIAIDCVLSSGADIANIVNTAKISAAKNDRTVLSAKDFEAAVLDVSNGVERQSLQLGAPARRALAISESACALVSLLTKSSSRELRRISIVPRGLELSSSRSVPSSEDAMVSQSVEQLLARIDADIAGQIGQELLLGKSRIMSDSQTRCERATKLARSMSAELGMGKRLGFAASMFANENVDWRTPYLPAQTRSAIDEDAVERLKEAEERVLRLLRRNKSRLLALSEELLVRESLGRKEIERVVEEVPEDDFEVKTTNKID